MQNTWCRPFFSSISNTKTLTSLLFTLWAFVQSCSQSLQVSQSNGYRGYFDRTYSLCDSWRRKTSGATWSSRSHPRCWTYRYARTRVRSCHSLNKEKKTLDVGLILSQLLKLNGASQVVIAANKGIKIQVAKDIHASDVVIELDRENPDPQWDQIKTDYPFGFDIVVSARTYHFIPGPIPNPFVFFPQCLVI